ncbi:MULTISPECIES: bile acid:sodium symporter family protein [unclassified Streptomyces]|uniref:bile acid:sodium symporter family protein n=1 Tax=unclassified Streptomyces TaxID=2593676 RepID=UPI002ED207C5|nr:bile acid:sodium symporter [Streptomyces sp. NBC_00724]
MPRPPVVPLVRAVHVTRAPAVARALTLLQRRLTWATVAVYAAAALLPQAGLIMRQLSLGAVSVPGGTRTPLTLPSLLLAWLLFTAALRVPARDLPRLLRRPLPLLVGTLANTLIPLALLPCMAVALGPLPDADGCSGLLTGLALVGAMPVAGGATIWGSRAGGNQSLIVGIVLTSTLLSPCTIPLTLSAASTVTRGHYAQDLSRLATVNGGPFAVISVIVPCAVGLLVQQVLPAGVLARHLPWLGLLGLVDALLLTYSNAAGALGGFLLDPRPALLVASVVVAAVLCAASFAIGWCLARAVRADRADTVAITLTCGMNNSSAGAVLAATNLSSSPHVLLPVLAYSLLQKCGAGLADSMLSRRGATSET